MLFSVDAECSCGRRHKSSPARIVIEPNAIAALPAMAGELTRKAAVVFFDTMTFALFGQRVQDAFAAAGRPLRTVVLGDSGKPFEPTPEAAARVRAAAEQPDAGVLAGVGSGAINDLGKYVAHQLGMPYISVATAPSMDGYMAPISALLVDGVKVTYNTKAPDGVIADLTVLAGAPLHLVSAGFADVLGKLTSLRDWEMAHVLFDEYWCPAIAANVERVASHLKASAAAVAERSESSVRLLTEGLLQAGISVVYVGNSRPTSGSEHLISHYVEMRRVNEGKRPPAHGHVVGLGMLVVSELVQALLKLTPDEIRTAPFNPPAVADVVAELRFAEVPENFGKSKFDRAARDARLPRILERWDAIRAVLRKVPTPEEIRSALQKVQAPTTLRALGLHDIGLQMVRNARYMRERYTMLDLAADLGVLDREAERIVAQYR